MLKTSFKFWREVKRQTRLAITAAVGFIIAYSWKDYVIQAFGSTFKDIQSIYPSTSSFLTAFFLTLIGVGFILISSKLLK